MAGANTLNRLPLTAVLLLCAVRVSAADPTVTLEPCADDVGVDGAECTTLEVFENRALGEGRSISLNIAVLPALGLKVQPDPLFVLAGGPGQAATDLAELVDEFMRRIRRERDIVLVDQRGTGDSNPLDCEFVDSDSLHFLPEDRFLDPLRDCLASFDADTRFYTTPVAMDDLDDVRAALGYDRINLWGGSYGTRAALVYLRRHEEHVRSVILDGLAPTSIKLPLSFGQDGNRALDMMLDDCATSPDCGPAFAGVREKLYSLLARLDREPVRTRIQHPRTGEWIEVPVTRNAVALLVRAALYSAELSALLPLVIERAHEGDFGPLAAMSDPWTDLDKAMSVGMLFSVICSEDIPGLSDADRRELSGEPFLGSAVVDVWSKVCGFWPRGEVPAGYYDPTVSDKPVLVLSGELDPVTPPRWGEEVVQHLENGRHVVVPGVGHGTLVAGCVPKLMAKFIDQGSAKDLDVECVKKLRRPPFFSSFTGPGPKGAP